MPDIAEIGPIIFSVEELNGIPFVIDGDADDQIGFDVDATFISGADIEPYHGAYTVAPLFEEQTLETKNKRMTDNLTVGPIRISVTTNQAGGNTVYIGEE